MDAAGYKAEDIAAELGCGERQARGLIREGLAAVQMVQLFKDDLRAWWLG